MTWLAAAIVGLAACAVYCNSFAGAFVFDDGTWIEHNQSIRHLWPIWPLFNPSNAGVIGGRPAASLTLALNFAAGGLNVWGYHAVNLTIHILAAWTLFGILRRTLLLPKPRDVPPLPQAPGESGAKGPPLGSVAMPLALAATLIWTVHPLQTQAVTYIIQRTESLVALFYLLTLYCVLRGATAIRHARWWYVAAALSCLLGAATKEVIVTAPLVVLLYDRTFLSGSFRRAIVQRWGLYLALAATWGAMGGLLIATGFHGGTTGFTVGRFTWWSYFCTQPGVLAHYLRLAFWPVGLSLDYGWPPAQTPSEILLPGLLIVGLLGLTAWGVVKRPALGFLGAWFFLILAPTSSIVPIKDAAFEHRMYLPLAALAVLVVLGGKALWDRLLARSAESAPPLRLADWAAPVAVLAAVLIALGWATVARNHDYRSEVAIWQDTVEKRPDNARALYSLGLALHELGKTGQAIADYEAALKIDPDYAQAHTNLGVALIQTGRADDAFAHLQRAVEIDPQNGDAHNDLATMLADRGQMAEAVTHLQTAIKLDSDNLGAHDDLGNILRRMGRLDDAVAEYNRALEIDPNNATVHYNLANALTDRGDFDKAIMHYRASLRIKPDNPNFRFNFGKALYRRGMIHEAIDQWRVAIQLQPAQLEIVSGTAWLLATSPNPSDRNGREAVDLAQLAVQMSDGRNLAAGEVLAAAYAEAGQFPQAIDEARRTFALAKTQNDGPRMSDLSMQIGLYEARSPYHQPPPPPSVPAKPVRVDVRAD